MFSELNPLKLKDCVWNEFVSHDGEQLRATVKISSVDEDYNTGRRDYNEDVRDPYHDYESY